MGETPVSGIGDPGAVDFVTLFLAARILQAAGFDAVSAAKALTEVYSVEVEPSQVEEWFKALPEEVRRKRALLDFLQTLSRDKLWALRYVGGAIMGDGDEYGKLRVKDWLFIDAYAKALAVLTGDPNMQVRRTKDGRYYTKSFYISRYVRRGLWKILAYLDYHDEIKHFLAGLLDAEGSLSPHIVEKDKSLRIQLTFTNTNLELVNFVMESLRLMGLNPSMYVRRRSPRVVDRKMLVPKQPLYEINTHVPFPKVMTLTKVGFRCSREQKLFSFFILVKDLPPRQRYEVFTRCWRKNGSKWWPSSLNEMVGLGEQYQRETYIVKCRRCGQPGTFELRREVDGGMVRNRILIHHGSKVCELGIAEKEVKEGENTARIKCPRCGKPGYVYTTTAYVRPRRPHKYLIVGVSHRLGGRKTSCRLASLHLISIGAQEPQPPSAHRAETKGE